MAPKATEQKGEKGSSKTKKKSTSWRKTKRGKRDLLRAVRHRTEKSQEMFFTLGDDPDVSVPKLSYYPSNNFLAGAENFMLSRYCNFILQAVLILARVFQVPRIIKNTYGEGLMTSARAALFFCRTTEMTNQDALNLKHLRRHLYARMLTDLENKDQVEKVLKDEWTSDRTSSLHSRLDTWLPEHLSKMVTEGRYPMTNIMYDLEAQWDHVWQELMFQCLSRVRLCTEYVVMHKSVQLVLPFWSCFEQAVTHPYCCQLISRVFVLVM